MKIVVLGLASDDVGAGLSEVQVSFGEALEAATRQEHLVTHVQTLFFTPIITRPGIGPFPDRIRYLRSEPAVNIAINIPYERWITGNRIEHANLIADALVRGIDQIKDGKINGDAKTALRRIVENARLSITAAG